MDVTSGGCSFLPYVSIVLQFGYFIGELELELYL
jgi:hypothetical protein